MSEEVTGVRELIQGLLKIVESVTTILSDVQKRGYIEIRVMLKEESSSETPVKNRRKP